MTRVMLDSGAFSVWRKGNIITVPEYGAFLSRNHEAFSAYVSLDVMPGKPGAYRTPAITEQAASASWDAWRALRTRWALDPIPVFHCGEAFNWLDKYLDAGASYIGISAEMGRHNSQKQVWLDGVFSHLLWRGVKVRTHGFGITSPPLIHRYPWTSVDSVTWILYAGYGSIFLPRATPEGKPDFKVGPLQLLVTGRPPEEGKRAHVDRIGSKSLVFIKNYLKDFCGELSLKDVRASSKVRSQVNAYFYLNSLKVWRTPAPQYTSGLFKGLAQVDIKRATPLFYFGSQSIKNATLDAVGADCRLVSYVSLKGKDL